MRVPTAQRTVQIDSPVGFRQSANASPDAFGANVGQALSQAGKDYAEIAKKRQEEDDTKAILDATNGYKQEAMKFFSGENGIFAQKGDNARNAGAQAEEFLSQLRTKYVGQLGNDRQRMYFENHIMPTEINYLQDSRNHQEKERHAAFQNTIKTGIATDIQGFTTTYTSPDTANTHLANVAQKVASLGQREGWASDVIAQQTKLYKTKAVNDAFEYAIRTGDNNGARKIIDTWGAVVTPETKGQMEEIYRQKTEKVQNVVTAQDIVNGSSSLEEALSKIPSVVKNGSVKNVTWEQAKTIVAGAEGPTYTAVNPDSGAYGKYQFMPKTWEGLMGPLPMTPENQEKAFEKMHKDTFAKYGVVGVLVANYAGPQNAERFAKGLPLINDEGKEYSADAPQYYNGQEYPSVRQYVNNALSQMPASQQDSIASADARIKLETEVKNQWATKEYMRVQKLKNSMDAFDNYLINNKPSSINEIEDAARSFGFTGADLLGAIGKGKQVAGLLRIERKEIADDAYESAIKDIRAGSITTKAEIGAKYGDKLEITRLMTLENFLDTTYNKSSKVPAALQNKDNVEAFDGVLKELNIKDKTEHSRIMEKVIVAVREMQDKGFPVSRKDIEDLTREQGQKVILKKGILRDTKIYVGDVPSGWTIDDQGPIDQNGIRPDKYVNGKFYKTINGVDIEMRQ